MTSPGFSAAFAWCARCERVYPTVWWVEQHWHCPNPNCNGGLKDAWAWAPGCELLQEHPEYLEVGERYPLLDSECGSSANWRLDMDMRRRNGRERT